MVIEVPSAWLVVGGCARSRAEYRVYISPIAYIACRVEGLNILYLYLTIYIVDNQSQLGA